MKKFLLFIALLIILAGCTQDNSINKAGESANYKQNSSQILTDVNADTKKSGDYIDYTEASKHVGSYKSVRGRVDNVYYSSKSDTTFLNFCPNYKTCPFSSVVFSSDKSKFGNLSDFEGRTVEATGLIKTYQGRSEVILNNPSQIKIID